MFSVVPGELIRPGKFPGAPLPGALIGLLPCVGALVGLEMAGFGVYLVAALEVAAMDLPPL